MNPAVLVALLAHCLVGTAFGQTPAAGAARARTLKKVGIVKHDDRWMRKADVRAIKAGKVQHPDTGLWIEKGALDKAKQGLFPKGKEWISREQADKGHSDWRHPWVLIGPNVRIVTIYPLTEARSILNAAEAAVPAVLNVLWDPSLPLPHRATVFVMSKQSDYQAFGQTFDQTGHSAHGAFLASGHDDQPAACFYGEKSWGKFYLKFAVGVAVYATLVPDRDLDPERWLMTAVGAFNERWANRDHAKYFAPIYLQKGGVRELPTFFNTFGLSGEQSATQQHWNLFQSGLLFSYIATNPDKKTHAAWTKVREAITKRKGVKKMVKKLEKVLAKKEGELKKHLKRIQQ
ncbi:MAG: hypothetical protein CMJ85_00255 [Planctomycetes bacterium]|nr:hypothetical protein [Planctomycetota bacterium]